MLQKPTTVGSCRDAVIVTERPVARAAVTRKLKVEEGIEKIGI